jgi:cytochrome c553
MSIRSLGVLVAALIGSAGCLDAYGVDPGPGGTDAGGAGPDLADVGYLDAVEQFNSKVAPILGGADGKTGSCGACHAKTGGVGPAFMETKADSTMLQTLLAYPGMIGKTPDTSRLYVKGVHEGPAFNGMEAPVVAAWIMLYSRNAPKPLDGGVEKPTVAPFEPVMGANTIDVSVIDKALAGTTITFTAKALGSSLQLSKIEVVTPATMGVHIVHPLWVTWDAKNNATPDPIDSFSNLDQTVQSGTTAPLGPGTLVLPNWATGQKLNVVFTNIEAKAASLDGGTVTGCKASANFQANVRPLLAATCYNCHGANPPAAGLAMNAALSAADQCANLLGEVNLTTPASSALLQKPNPQVAGHNGNNQKIQNFAAFSTAVNNWINLEK